MADVDDRRDYRGGGGGYRGGGGGNRRKRAREDDDDDRRSYRNQRPRQDIPPGTRIKRGLLEIAEDPVRLPHESAMAVAKLTTENYEDEYVRDTFTMVALKLVVEQPFKIPFVAGTVLFAHAEKQQVADDLMARAGPQLQEYLDKGMWRESRLMLRFLACLSRMFAEDGILPILDELFSRAVDLQTASSEDAVGIELVKIILLTIPYLIASSPDESLPQKAAELLEKTDIVATTPHQLESLVDPFPTSDDETEKPMACASVISLMQRQLQEEAANGWPLKCIPRVYDPAYKPKVAEDMMDGETKVENGENGDNGETAPSGTIAFPTVDVPSPINPGTRTLFPELFFSVYADQEIESVPPTNNIAASLIRDTIVDTINILDFNRNATARFLNMIDHFWPHETFVKRSTAFDKLRDVPHGRPTWKPEDVCIDAIFSQIFMLPAPEHRQVYYHSLITESCKISPGAIAPSLGRAIRFLFRSLDVMDQELAYRYMDWFAHHLSNFEFRWKWSEWTGEVDQSDLTPRKAFLNGLLDKESRLSFAKRIRDTLPAELAPLIPKSKEQDIPQFKFADEKTPYSKEGKEVLSMLRKKEAEEEIDRVLDSAAEQAKHLGVEDPLVVRIDIYMTAILSIGAKSLSHVLSTIDRCKGRLLAIGQQSELARRQIITSVVDFWKDHPGTAVNIIDKLLNYTIITPMNVIQWALGDALDRGRNLAFAHTYEMISITMFKVSNRVRQLTMARNNPALPFQQRQEIDQGMPQETKGMRDLFAAIMDAVAGVASGAQDEMIERFDDNSAEMQLLKGWGARWARVWQRKAAVEEAIVTEGVAKPMEEPPAPEVPVVEEDMDQVEYVHA